MECAPRYPRQRIEADEPWYKEYRNAIALTGVVFILCFALVLGYQGYRRQQASHVLRAFTTQLDAETEWMEHSVGRPDRHLYVDRVVTEHVPGGSLAACKAKAGAEINERFARCRSGYRVTRIVREYR